MTVITFTPDGSGHALYTEAIELSRIGALAIRRAASIEFDHTRQQWCVKDGRGLPVFNHPSRQACLDWEKQWLQKMEDKKHELQPGAGAVAAGA